MKAQLSLLLTCISMLLMVSCSTPMEKRTKKIQREGKTILEFWGDANDKERYVAYLDNEAAYIEDIQTKTRIKIIDFKKEYCVTTPYVYIADGELEIRERYDDSLIDNYITLSPAEYQFRACSWGIFAYYIDEESGGVYGSHNIGYAFLSSHPEKCFSVRDAGYYHGTGIETVYCLCFVTKGNLWDEYGIEPGHDCAPKFPEDKVIPNVLYYWTQWDYDLPKEILDFYAYLQLYPDGSYKFADYGYSFKFGKERYSTDEVRRGDMFDQLGEKMMDAASEHLINRAINEAVDIKKLMHDYEYNKVKAKKDYPVGKDYFIHARLDKISECRGTYKYEIMTKYDETGLIVYTNDESFAELSYPCKVLFHGNFKEVEDASLIGFLGLHLFMYKFDDARLLAQDN